jgi:Protein of unknown function (DUF4256)
MNPPAPAELLDLLAARFDRHPQRHPGLDWRSVQARLASSPAALAALGAMEASGGEPDVLGGPTADAALVFVDCAAESPLGRRSLCYDAPALAARRNNPPTGSALACAAAWGIRLLDEAQYRQLQSVGEFDLKTSSWLLTPPEVRERGGALFGDRRYGRVFTYHNGADAYYAARGFRGWLAV